MLSHSAQALGEEAGSFRFSVGPIPREESPNGPGGVRPGPAGPNNAVLSPTGPSQSVQGTSFCGLWTVDRGRRGGTLGLESTWAWAWTGHPAGPARRPHHALPTSHREHRATQAHTAWLEGPRGSGRGGCSVGSAGREPGARCRAGLLGPPPRGLSPPGHGEEVRLCP